MRNLMLLIAAAVGVVAVLWAMPPGMKPGMHAAIIGGLAVALALVCLRPNELQPTMYRALACGVGMPLIAWSLSSTTLLFAVMGLWVPLVARRFGYVVPIYVYSLLLLPGLDQTVSLGSVKLFEFGVHDALGLGSAAVLFFHPNKARVRRGMDIPAVAVLLMLSLALSRETTPTNLVRVTINVFLDLGLPYYIASRGIRTMDEMRTAILWVGLGGITLSAILLYEAARGWPMYNSLYPLYGVPMEMMVKARGGALRAGGPFIEPTSIAMVLSTCCIAMWLSRASFRSGFLHGVICVVTIAGLTGPQSRGAWIGLGFAIAVGLAFQGRFARLFQAGGAVAITLAILFAAASASPELSETMGLSGTSSETSIYRRKLFDRGLEEFAHSPIVGYSMPAVTARLSDIRQGEGIVDFVNTYVWLLLISGVIGTTMFFGTFGYFAARILRYRRALLATAESAAAGAFTVAALAMPVEMLFFTSFGGRPAFFVFLVFGFSVALLRHCEGLASAPAPTFVRSARAS